MATDFGVSRVVVEFINGGRKYELVYQKESDPELVTPNAIYINLKEAALASTIADLNTEKFGTFERLLNEGMIGGKRKPRLIGEAGDTQAMSNFVCMHDGMCDWFFVAEDPALKQNALAERERAGRPGYSPPATGLPKPV